ncbi:hypothetical protein LOTGIDRAFT_152502 [Lottia gigantea]|uniref:G-protein coupled receptors family 1 profile domain-containing protein n=1 Tax=Lottia gigantea TaxID=225164 RepID=V4CSV6_LOTGI|nr:hypothetical protein LOTGIDRAFT_152502 [Lottia gigantea]ESP05640.1 hypothetical protein LOTGIDRAFT_152502 [Lottia gigantea]
MQKKAKHERYPSALRLIKFYGNCREFPDANKFAAFFTFTWIFGELLCKSLVYVQNLSSICSVLTLTVMSLERYYAILHPLKAKYVCSVRKAKRAIVMIWLLSIILALPIAFLQNHKEVGVVRKGYWCIKDWEDLLFSRVYEVYMFCMMLVIPVSIMMFAYCNISLELWHVSNQRVIMKNGRQYLMASTKSSPFHIGSDKSPVIKSSGIFKISSEDDQTRKQVIKMLVSVIIIFIICWAPILTTNLLTAFNILHHLNYGYLKPMRFSFYLLSYLNSCVNPIIYGFMSKSFRQTFLHAICTCIRGKAYSRRMYFLRQNSSQTRSTHYNTSSRNCDIELNRTVCDHNCAYGSCDNV